MRELFAAHRWDDLIAFTMGLEVYGNTDTTKTIHSIIHNRGMQVSKDVVVISDGTRIPHPNNIFLRHKSSG